MSLMLRFLADENFNNVTVWGVARRNPAVDIVRIQDVGLGGAAMRRWAASTGWAVARQQGGAPSRCGPPGHAAALPRPQACG